jgi:hypothetical protein
MELKSLQKSGMIRIGDQSDRNTIFVLRSSSDPNLLAVGYTDGGLSILSDTPFLAGLEHLNKETNIVTVCHHSSAQEISGKIRSALDNKKVVGPKGIEDVPGMDWFKASFDEVIYVYPPFAKIFLSSVPIEDKSAKYQDIDDTDQIKSPEDMDRDFERARARERDESEIDTKPTKVKMLTARSAGNLVSMLLVIGVAAITALTGLNRDNDPATSFGQEVVYFASDLLSKDVSPFTRTEVFLSPFQPDFATWYNTSSRGGHTGRSFGLPFKTRGFYLRTWRHPVPGGEALYAAYEYDGMLPTAKYGLADDAALSSFMRIPETSFGLFEAACNTVFSNSRFRFGTQDVQSLQILVSANSRVLDRFEVDFVACIMESPRRNFQ